MDVRDTRFDNLLLNIAHSCPKITHLKLDTSVQIPYRESTMSTVYEKCSKLQEVYLAIDHTAIMSYPLKLKTDFVYKKLKMILNK